MLHIFDLLSWLLENLKSASVRTRHRFSLTNSCPIYRCPKKMTLKHYATVKGKSAQMLEARITVFSPSAWSFTVLIASKKDEKQRSCNDYCSLNQSTDSGRWPLSVNENFLMTWNEAKYSLL